MEDEFEMRGLLAHEVPDVTIENFQSPLIALVPWLVHRLNGVKGGMVTPLFNQTFNSVLSP